MSGWFASFFKAQRKGQLKIQQMAFILVALMIFFSIVTLLYFSIRLANLREDVELLREQEVIETVRKMSGTAEFAFTAEDCSACIDLDKVLMLKERPSYKGFWKNIALLQIARVYPFYGNEIECTRQNYPNCDKITIVEENKGLIGHSAFVALCGYDKSFSTNKCELGKIIMAFETIE